MTLRLGLAHDHHWKLIIRLVEEAAAWLRNTKDTDQWAMPWPNRAARDARIWADIAEGKTWIAWDGDAPAATITWEEKADPMLSSEWDDGEPAVYVHRLVVSRSHGGGGVGSDLLNWAGSRAALNYGARWIRIDVWKTNQALHRYYLRQGFAFVRNCRNLDYPSGALFQKATHQIAGVGGGLVEEAGSAHPAMPWEASVPLQSRPCWPRISIS